jgi:hypothetical protein
MAASSQNPVRAGFFASQLKISQYEIFDNARHGNTSSQAAMIAARRPRMLATRNEVECNFSGISN